MTDQELAERLARLDGDFKAADTGDDKFALPEPGTYMATLDKIDSFESKAGQFFLKLVYVIDLDQKYKGKTVDMIYNMEDASKFDFLKRDMRTLGVDVDNDNFSLAQIMPGAQVWDGLLDCPVRLSVREAKSGKIDPKTNKVYRNAWLDEKLGGPIRSDIPSDVPAGGAASTITIDDVPFGPSVI